MNADLLLVDEKRGQRIAAARGLRVTGSLGVLAEAKVRGTVTSCGPVVDAMIGAGFWIGDDLRAKDLAVWVKSTRPVPYSCDRPG